MRVKRDLTDGDAGHGRGEIGVETDSSGRGAEMVMVVMPKGVQTGGGVSMSVGSQQAAAESESSVQTEFGVVQRRQTRLDHRLETIDEQFDVVGILSRDGERTGETPEAAEATRLEVAELLLLLAGVVAGRTADHLVNDRLNGGQDRLVVRQRENGIDFRVQQIVNDGKDFGKDDARLRQILVDDAHLVLVRGVSHERRQDGQQQRLRRRVGDHIRVQQKIRLAVRLEEKRRKSSVDARSNDLPVSSVDFPEGSAA